MKRKTKLKPGQIWYKKLGGGSFVANIDGKAKMIKPNQEFEARPEEIPENFRDVVVPLDAGVRAEIEKKSPSKPASKLEYFVKPRAAKGYWDVVDKMGKVQNEKALRKDAAEALIESLME